LVCLAKCLQDVCLGYLFPPLSSLPSSSPSPCHKPLSWGEETHHHLGTSRLPELTGNPLLLTAATFGHVSLSPPASLFLSLFFFTFRCLNLNAPSQLGDLCVYCHASLSTVLISLSFRAEGRDTVYHQHHLPPSRSCTAPSFLFPPALTAMMSPNLYTLIIYQPCSAF